MPDSSGPAQPDEALPRQIADAYVADYILLDPIEGTSQGVAESHGKLPDFSPEGEEARAELRRAALRSLAEAEQRPGAAAEEEERCARLLAERLNAELGVHEAEENLRRVSNLMAPHQDIAESFTLMPTETTEDWAAVAQRLRAVPEALQGYRASLRKGLDRGLPGGPRQVATMIDQMGEWLGSGPEAGGQTRFAQLVADGPEALRSELDRAVETANGAVDELRNWLRDVYAPAIEGSPEVVGRERYERWARFWNGTDLDLHEAYEFGWSEYADILAQMRTEADAVLPGSTVTEALEFLQRDGRAVQGVDEVQAWLQGLMDEAIRKLDGTHFDLAEPVRRVESRIAPPGGAAAPYYTNPSIDFSRPGRTWLPTMGNTQFKEYDLVSTWYHEGVPGHHLQLAQWTLLADRLSRYQTTIGMVSANVEGWALYAERLMDELGFLTDPQHRMGFLIEQMMRAVRVIIDIGMHLELAIPSGAEFHPGERWTPDLGLEFFSGVSAHTPEYRESEIVRYLGLPGQAIGYKLGERVWLRGRAAASAAHGPDFDLKKWHMAALSQGSLGLDDLEAVLASL